MFFWERTDTPLTHALMATKIYRSLHEWIPANDYTTRGEYLRCKDEFEAIADRLVSKCHEVSARVRPVDLRSRPCLWIIYL